MRRVSLRKKAPVRLGSRAYDDTGCTVCPENVPQSAWPGSPAVMSGKELVLRLVYFKSDRQHLLCVGAGGCWRWAGWKGPAPKEQADGRPGWHPRACPGRSEAQGERGRLVLGGQSPRCVVGSERTAGD